MYGMRDKEVKYGMGDKGELSMELEMDGLNRR